MRRERYYLSITQQCFRYMITIGLALVLSLSFPVFSHEEYRSESTHSEFTSGLSMSKPFIRQSAPLLLKLKLVSQLVSPLFYIFLLESLHLPLFIYPFKRCIMLLLRRLFLDPINYTSTFVSRANLSVL